MATIGSIAVTLRAETTKFVSGMGRAAATLRSFGSHIPGISALTGKLGLALGAITGGSLAYFIKQQADLIDQTAKVADRLGATTEGLVGLEHAARLSGSSTEGLHKGLERMLRTLGEAAAGQETAKAALDALGLSATDLMDLKAEDAFATIADRLNMLSDSGDRVRLAFDLFGRSGVELLNTVSLGSAGIAAMRKEAEDLGLTFSRVDAAKVEAANDAFTRLGEMIQGVARTAAIELAPYMEAAFKAMVEWGTAGEGMGAKVVDAIEWVVSAVAKAVDVFNVVKGTIQLAFGLGTGVVAVFVKALGWAIDAGETLLEVLTIGFVDSDLGERIKAAADDMWDFGKATAEAGYAAIEAGVAGEYSEKAAAAFARIREEAQKAAEASVAMAEAAKGTVSAEDLAAQADELERQAEARKAAAKEADREAKALEQLVRTTKDRLDKEDRILTMSREEREWADELLEIESLRARGLDDLADQAERILAAKKEELRIEEEKEKLVERVRESQHASERAADEARRKRETAEGNQASLREELEILRASNDYERERIRIKNELIERTREAEGDLEQAALARKIADEKLAELERQVAEDAERTAAAARETATATTSTTQALRAQLDITKRFAAMPGSGGLFGFGAGQAGFSWSEGGRERRARRAPRPGGGGAKAAEAPAEEVEVPELPDLAPHVQAVLKAWQKVPPLWERIEKELRELESGTVSGVDRMGRATERAVLQMRTAIRELQAKVRSFEERLKRAADLGVAGG